MMARIFLFFLPFTLFAAKAVHYAHPDHIILPWLTGPLISPSSVTIPQGHYNIEPFLFITANMGEYDNDWSIQKNDHVFFNNSMQIYTQVGILPWLDFLITPTFYYNRTAGVSSWALGDLPVGFDVQLCHPPVDDWMPAIKLILQETFPTGKYQKLNPKKKGTDAGGTGAYITEFGIVFGKLFHFKGTHFLSVRWGAEYTLPTTVHVKGFNAYGGGATTNGKVKPAQSLEGFLGAEYTLSQHWALALDIIGIWAKGSNFSGDPGLDDEFNPNEIDTMPLIQYSLAPAFEYNWSPQLGLIAGAWFTVAGKNAVQFISGIIAVNYYH